MLFDQREYDLRCEWGEAGVEQLASISDAVVIVDVLSFSTCVDIAVGRGAIVYPYRWKDESADTYANSIDATLANFTRASASYSLSPASLMSVSAGERLVLPSPNGATLSLATEQVPTFAGCLRNARAIADALAKVGRKISIIPAGEKWEVGSLRPAFEDIIGAGAILIHLSGTRSPEAELAISAFLHFREKLEYCLKQCGSGRELIERGFEHDVKLASALDVSQCVPILLDGAYVAR